MAPIAGMTDRPFRRIVMEFGARMVTTELLSANALVRNSQKTFEMLPQPGEPKPVAAQVFGADPEIMRDAAVIVERSPCDIIDINFGCPVKKVVKTGAGAAALKDVKKAAKVVEAVTRAVKKPVTVKIRTGWDKATVNAVEMARAMEGAGAAAVAVHGRTASQGYSGEADWGVIADVAAALQIPVIGNGDIRTPEDAVRRLETSGCALVMIGRGALGAPWIFHQINTLLEGGSCKPVEPEEMACTMLLHLDMMTSLYGERNAARKMRSRIGYYIKGVPAASRLREAANAAATAGEMKDLVKGFFERLTYAVTK